MSKAETECLIDECIKKDNEILSEINKVSIMKNLNDIPSTISSCNNLSENLTNHPTQFSLNKNEDFKFDIPPEAPVFTPTEEEFKNPLIYINNIRPIAEKYGVCKIKPPSAWQPPFTVDVDRLKFTPRIQRLNELEAKTRIKLNFLDQIAKFWELQGCSLKIPMVERKALDLYSLHRIVQEEGGMEQTVNNRKWSKVAARLGYPQGKSVGTILKNHYERILYPYDVYTSGKPLDMKLELEELDDQDYKPHCIESRQQVCPPHETTARRSKRFAQNNVKDENIKSDIKKDMITTPTKISPMKTYSKPDMKTRMGGLKSNVAANATRLFDKQNIPCDPLAKYVCHTCVRGDVEESMLLCDGCDDSYHTFCLIPPLVDIPKGDWLCPNCVVQEVNKPIEAFGFEQAQREYTLQQFGEMADRFKSDYFNMPVHVVPTSLVEREFWRIVSSIDEDVTVEYGADLHTMDHGSGFPTRSSLYLLPEDQEYAESSWNLNNLPILEDSILGHINADISGMKIPWMYVGMCFATFCWHNEDHWSYSINYMHWGEPKTWYGVPGNKAEIFEDTMKSAAPELFQSQPDLLHQLVTIMNPNILQNAGVPVYRTDQHAGEFIITFPRAYHAGFNQGYNFAEAVNFAPADWMKTGRECINHYSTLRRYCVFSHDELVCKMSLEPERLSYSIATACYLDMAEMVDSEKKLRKSLLEWGVTKAVREAFELIPDDERQCEFCKTTCFLSAVICTCSKNLVCLRHYTELCKCAPDRHTLKYRYTLDELPLMLKKLKLKAEDFENWLKKIRDIINPKEKPTITLEELQQLASEAEEKKFPNSVVLERVNSAVLEAEKCITVILQLDINKIRTRTRTSGDNSKYKLTMDELNMFIQEIDNLWCVIKEGESVRELQQMGKEFNEKVDQINKTPFKSINTKELEELVEEGSSLCIELPNVFQLKDLLSQKKWYDEARQYRDSSDKISLTVLKRLLSEGLKLTPSTIIETELAYIDLIITSVQEWEKQVQNSFETFTEHNIGDMEKLLFEGDLIEGILPSYNMLKDACKKIKEWLRTVEILQANENYPYFHTLENVVTRGKNISIQLVELKKMETHLAAARNWKDRASRAFLKKKSQLSLLDALSPRTDSSITTRKKNELEVIKKFNEEMTPMQMVIAFKDAEELELRAISELRKINEGKNPETDTFCICHRYFYGSMYKCQLCCNWFHAQCVPPPRDYVRSNRENLCRRSSSTTNPMLGFHFPKPTRNKDKENKYLCQLCLRSRRPRLETILALLVCLQRLPIRIPEGEALQCLTERAMNWQDRARQTLIENTELKTAFSKLSISCLSEDEDSCGEDASKKMDSERLKKIVVGSDENNSNEASQTHLFDKSASPTNIEHAYFQSKTELTSSPALSLKQLSNCKPPLITLSQPLVNLLQQLMMEGDMLEVSLDETYIVWKILNLAKQDYTELQYINSKYKIRPIPIEVSILSTFQKRKVEEISKSSSKFPKLDDSLQKYIDKSITTTLANEILSTSPFSKTNPVNVLNMNNLGVSPQSDKPLSDTTKSIASLPYAKTYLNFRKLVPMKRGRKLKLGKPFVQIARELNAKKKLKKTAKKKQNENSGKTSSDDDDDCSATECARPAGREVDWIQCDGCEKWFHMLCVGLDLNKVKTDDDFFCNRCTDKKPPQKVKYDEAGADESKIDNNCIHIIETMNVDECDDLNDKFISSKDSNVILCKETNLTIEDKNGKL